MLEVDNKLVRRLRRRDRIAGWVITLGGLTIIASVVAIIVLILGVTWPLFQPAESELLADPRLPASIPIEQVASVGVERSMDDTVLTAHVLLRVGQFAFLDLHQEAAKLSGDDRTPIPGVTPGKVVSVTQLGGSRYSVAFDTGEVALVEAATLSEKEQPKQGEEKLGAAQGAAGAEPAAATKADPDAKQAPDSKAEAEQSAGSESEETAAQKTAFSGAGERVRNLATVTLPPDWQPTRAVIERTPDGEVTCAAILKDGTIALVRQVEVFVEEGGGGGGLLAEITAGAKKRKREKRQVSVRLENDIPGKPTALAMTRSGTTVYAGTDTGVLMRWEVQWVIDDQGKGRGSVTHREVVPASRHKAAITALTMVQGDVSVAVGDAQGRFSTWFPVRSDDKQQKGKAVGKLQRIHDLKPLEGPVRTILPSRQNKSLLCLGENGTANLDYMTSERTLLTVPGDESVDWIGYAAPGNAMITLDGDGRLTVLGIDNPHPEISWKTLFGKVHYDNYPEPDYVYQTSGTDEPKYSLVPVIFGTLKATVYAMAFALPLALLAAMYVSHFTTPGFKRFIKPVVEIMAAVPSVVVGFLVLLWLAPVLGNWIVAVFASLLAMPVTFVLFMLVWQKIRKYDWAKRLENGYEFLVLVPVLFLGVAIAALLAGPIESWLFAGDFKQWLYDATEKPYQQLNSIAIAFGLGFAVIPIIFSISEDALSSIPHSLTAASLALGASRWQTVRRVILPSASPGIFAATMIGFGRAVGETMIVFMAAGNTPLMEWSPFNGFRTLSANIATEISEASRGGTHYRILFLCAVLLFLMTFLLNTVAEVVRQHLRKRYGRY